MALPLSCGFIDALFGPNTPAVPVFGSQDALNDLINAIGMHGLSIQAQTEEVPHTAVELAYRHLQLSGEFPTHENTSSLCSMTDNDRIAVGIDMSKANTEPVTGHPAFVTLDVHQMTRVLFAVGQYHEQYALRVHGVPQRFAYQLGIVTMTMQGSAPSFQAELYTAHKENVQPTNTIWLYRWFFNGKEHWRAIGAGVPDAPQPNMTTVLQPTPVNANNKKRLHSMLEEADSDGNSGQGTVSPQGKQRFTGPEVSNLTFDQILAGQAGPIGDSAQLITRNVILHVARYYSNTEIFYKINAALAVNGKKPLKYMNVITRRITVAISSLATKSHRESADIRAALNAARKATGVTKRMRAFTAQKKAANNAVKAMLMLDAEGEGEIDAEAGDGDGDGSGFDDDDPGEPGGWYA